MRVSGYKVDHDVQPLKKAKKKQKRGTVTFTQSPVRSRLGNSHSDA